MRVHLKGNIPTIQRYMDNGWRVDYFPTDVNEYIIYSPTGSVFRSRDIEGGYCPFCDEDSSQWEPAHCNHSKELLDEESNARNILNLLTIEPSLQCRNLP